MLIAVPEGDGLRVDTWLISCRVLGRRLDEAMFAALDGPGEKAGSSGAILCEYIPTSKNSVVAGLFERLGCFPLEQRENRISTRGRDGTIGTTGCAGGE